MHLAKWADIPVPLHPFSRSPVFSFIRFCVLRISVVPKVAALDR
ncbi:hypothetical protein B4100_2970 [Heyndrickxia coagulans]|nr:hypothetical protein B4100_2970 [Heyndrickxia coagulans]